MVDASGKPLPISRICGTDTEGIIDIGKIEPSTSLGQRIDSFYKRTHSGERTYDLLCRVLEQRGHPHDLRYSVKRLGHVSQANDPNLRPLKNLISRSEIRALAEYCSNFGELPPCNLNYPDRWGKFADHLRRLGI